MPNPMAASKLLVLAMLAALLVACQNPDETNTEDPRMSAALAEFHATQQAWRDTRRAELLAPEGWASLTGLHWIKPGAHFIGSDADNGIGLTVGPAHLGMIELGDDGTLRFVPAAGATPTLNGEPLRGETGLLSDADANGPDELGFDQGQGVATVIKRGDRYALRVKHEQAESRTGFAGIDYWPADPDWKIQGAFVAHPAGRTIEVASVIGTTEEVPNPGAIVFEHGGARYRLEALDEGGEGLFLVFADRTNGQGSYGAGRFLHVARPDADGRVWIDFNHAYNPPCAFTAFATCPLPPPENRLDLAITAGEKAYAGHALQ